MSALSAEQLAVLAVLVDGRARTVRAVSELTGFTATQVREVSRGLFLRGLIWGGPSAGVEGRSWVISPTGSVARKMALSRGERME